MLNKYSVIRLAAPAAMLAVLAGLPCTAQGAADGPQRLVVPLSEPSRPVSLRASLMSGGITVRTHAAAEVVVVAHDRSETDRPSRVNGMTRIPSRSLGLTITEDNNSIRVSSDALNREVDLEILVPRNTSLRLSCVNEGDIVVQGVKGDLELNNVNGAITATDIDGSVVANTTNGDVRVVFSRLESGKAMSFVSFNGDVDVTFLPDFRGTLRMSSAQGDVLTDFDVKLEPRAPVVNREDAKGRYRVQIEEETRGTVGGGGAEFHFKTWNGDVYIRKAR